MRPVSHRSSRSLENRLQSLPPEEAIPYLLKGLHHSLRQLIDEGLRRERIDMTFAHLATLFAIDAEPGLAGAELARRSSVTAQTMNTILHRMERDGQLQRRPHPSSPRADSWFVTPRGNRQLDRAKVVGKAIWRKMLSALAVREVDQLQSLLLRCLRGLDVTVEPIKPARAKLVRTKPARAKSRVPRKRRGSRTHATRATS
jgi:DNA-binding MarR family transcriptional regulator